MIGEEPRGDDSAADELLRRALLDVSSSVTVSLRVDGLPVSEALTVIFHARRDLGTLQTYVASGSRGAGATVSARELLRVPCDLDLADAEDREQAERLYARAGQRTARRAGRRGHRPRCMARAARRPDRQRRQGRSLGRAVRPPARPAAAADGADRARLTAPGDAGVQRADARRRTPPARDRVRAARFQPRVRASR